MDKKIIVGIIIVFICIVVGAIFLVQNDNANTVTIGNNGTSHIIVPNGFNVTNISSNKIVLTNGKSVFTVYEIKNKSIDEIFNEYNVVYKKNATVKQSTEDISGVTVRSLTLRVNGTDVHTNYYCEKNGITFQVYPSGVNNHSAFEKIVTSIS